MSEQPPKWKKIVKRTLSVLGIFFVLLFGGTFVVLRFYEDEVVGYALKKINDRLATSANIGSADLTFWETFPHAAIKFSDVYIQETGSEKDTLIFAQTGFLSFNVWDLFSGKYSANEIIVKDGFARLKVDKKGNDNWHILKAGTDTTSSFSLDIDKIDLSELDLSYENSKTQFYVDLNEVSGEIDGEFSSDKFECGLRLKTIVSELFSGKTSWMSDRTIEFSANFNANNVETKYEIISCLLNIDGVPFNVSGNYTNSEKAFIDLKVGGDDLTLSKTLGLVPSSLKSKVDDYSAEGKVTFESNLRGNISDKELPNFDAQFSMLDGTLKHRSSGVSLENLQLAGKFHWDKKQHKLSLTTCKGDLEGGMLDVQGSISDFSNPMLDLKVMANVGMEDVRDFMSLDTLEVCEGNIYSQVTIKGRPSLNQYELSGKTELSGGILRLKDSNRLFEKVGATVLFDNKSAVVQRLVGEVNGSDFSVNGALKNLIPFLLKENERLVAEAVFQSKELNLTDFLETEESSRSNKEYLLVLPDRIDFSLNSKIGKFSFGKFEATDISGILNLKNGKFSVDPVSFATSGGNFLSQLSLEPISAGLFNLRLAASFKDIDIQRLFTSFDNFGQEFITDRHLRGRTTASVQLSFVMSNALDIDKKTIDGLIDIGIKDGQLIGLESLQEVALYIKKNKLIAPFVDEDKFADRMKDIKFSYLENVIEIKNEQIIIPSMEIKSTALDISVNGKHGFDNRIDYTIGFRLRDILLKKDRGEADDGLGKQMFIYMRGTTSDPEFGIDKEASKVERQQEIAAEKSNIKALLKEEFGLFKNDKSVGSYEPQTQAPQGSTSVVWEEQDGAVQGADSDKNGGEEKVKLENESKPKEENTTTNKKGKKLPKWLQEKE